MSRRKLRILVIELVAPGPTNSVQAKVLFPNFATVMAQSVAVWCQEEGHDVSYVCYVGQRELLDCMGHKPDLVFVCAFTHAALAAYAVSNFCRAQGAVTVLGGPHARAFPAHALSYFDFVLGLTDRALLRDVLANPSPNRPRGVFLSSTRQPGALPGVQERWQFVAATHVNAPVKSVALLGSLGCPYTCHFCVDAEVPYQPLDLSALQADLRFIAAKMKKPLVVWHDPNFGVRFDEILGAIEEAVPCGSVDFAAESSLSLLTEARLRVLERNCFRAILPGIESWFELGGKSKTGKLQGAEKVRQVSAHINLIQRYIPYIQANFVMGLDSDSGAEPFELTADFIDAAPGAFSAIALLTNYGQSAPQAAELRAQRRLLPTPFQFLNSGYASNVIPKHYSWPEFYQRVAALLRHNFSWKAIWRRQRAVAGALPQLINLVRGISGEGHGRVRYLERTAARLQTDSALRDFLEGKTSTVPAYFADKVRGELGTLWDHLPPGALNYDPYECMEPASKPDVPFSSLARSRLVGAG
jgi:hypothetical protein